MPDISESPALAHVGHEAMIISNFDFTKREELALWAIPPSSSTKSTQNFHTERKMKLSGNRNLQCVKITGRLHDNKLENCLLECVEE